MGRVDRIGAAEAVVDGLQAARPVRDGHASLASENECGFGPSPSTLACHFPAAAILPIFHTNVGPAAAGGRKPVYLLENMLTRRAWLATSAAAAATLLTGRGVRAALAPPPEVLIYKSPSCGCCKLWVDHLSAEGFRPTVRDVDQINPLKVELGVPRELWSCHTALVDGYLLEGHVPGDLALKLIAEKPEAAGLAVPGMPMGSPGMEGPRKDRYNVIMFGRDGSTSVYASR
jgi:hypothetical protein